MRSSENGLECPLPRVLSYFWVVKRPRLRGSIQGSVTVGALPLGRTLILPEAIARVIGQYPGVRVVTDESAYETLVGSLRAGDVDFILGALRANDAASGLENERLMTEDLAMDTLAPAVTHARPVRSDVQTRESQATHADR